MISRDRHVVLLLLVTAVMATGALFERMVTFLLFVTGWAAIVAAIYAAIYVVGRRHDRRTRRAGE